MARGWFGLGTAGESERVAGVTKNAGVATPTRLRRWTVVAACLVVAASYLPHMFAPIHATTPVLRPREVIIFVLAGVVIAIGIGASASEVTYSRDL